MSYVFKEMPFNFDDDIVEDSDDDYQDKIFWDNYSSDYRTFINTYLNEEF